LSIREETHNLEKRKKLLKLTSAENSLLAGTSWERHILWATVASAIKKPC
jgi:hypothetical protein